MPFWKVRPGAKFAHESKAVPAGGVVELPRRIADEFPHLLDECDERGEILRSQLPDWAKALETVRGHETVDTLIEQRKVQLEKVADVARAVDESSERTDALIAQLARERANLEALETALAEATLLAQAEQKAALEAEAAAAASTAEA